MAIKPRQIEACGDHLLAKALLRSWTIRLSDIRLIKVGRVPSLVDEIGITLVANEEFFFTDANRWFEDVVQTLRFAQIFGADWYARAEGGEFFEHKGPISP